MYCEILHIRDTPCLSPFSEWCNFGLRDPILLTDRHGRPIIHKNRLTVYFNGRDKTLSDGGFTRVGGATCSTLLTDWSPNEGYIFEDGQYAAAGSVIQLSPTEFWLFYSFGTDLGFRRAASVDGKDWSIYSETLLQPEQFDCTRIGLPFVIEHDGRWIMLFEGIFRGKFKIFGAESSDGLIWTPMNSAKPLIVPPSGNWDGSAQANPSLGFKVFPDGSIADILFYNGYGEKNSGQWDLAAAPFGMNGKSAAVPFLQKSQIHWPVHRLEGARFVSLDDAMEDRILFFSLPTADSYQGGVIGVAEIVFTQKNSMNRGAIAEQRANDSLAKRYFKIWDTYPIQKFTQQTEADWLKKLIASGESVLVAGSGGGREIEAFLEKAGRIVALDISEGMLDVGRARFPETQIEWRQGDISNPPKDLVDFDHVLALGGVLAYMPDPFQAIVSMAGLLRSGGQLTLSVMNASHATEKPEAKYLSNGRVRRPLALETLRELLESAGFEVSDEQGIRFLVDLLPSAWNSSDECTSEQVQILQDAIALEATLIQSMPPELGKLLWVTAKKVASPKQMPESADSDRSADVDEVVKATIAPEPVALEPEKALSSDSRSRFAARFAKFLATKFRKLATLKPVSTKPNEKVVKASLPSKLRILETEKSSSSGSPLRLAARVVADLIAGFEESGGVSRDQYCSSAVYHSMAEGKYLQTLAYWHKEGWISDIWLRGRLKKAELRLLESAYLEVNQGEGNAAWGLGFSHAGLPADEPYLITTAYVAKGLLNLPLAAQTDSILDLKRGALRWIEHWLGKDYVVSQESLAISKLPSFSPNQPLQVFNAVAYAASVIMLATTDKTIDLTGGKRSSEIASALLDSVGVQLISGIGWPYSSQSTRIDLLHQCFIFTALMSHMDFDIWEKQLIATLGLLFDGTKFLEKFDVLSLTEATARQTRAIRSHVKLVGEHALAYQQTPARAWSLGELLLLTATLGKDSKHSDYWSVISKKVAQQIIGLYADPNSPMDHRQDMHVAHGLSAWLSLEGIKPDIQRLSPLNR